MMPFRKAACFALVCLSGLPIALGEGDNAPAGKFTKGSLDPELAAWFSGRNNGLPLVYMRSVDMLFLTIETQAPVKKMTLDEAMKAMRGEFIPADALVWLVRNKPPEAFGIFKEWVESDNPARRADAIVALGYLEDPRGVEVLASRLESGNPLLYVEELLVMPPAGKAFKPLITPYHPTSSWFIGIREDVCAVMAIARIGGTASVGALKKAALKSGIEAAGMAIQILGDVLPEKEARRWFRVALTERPELIKALQKAIKRVNVAALDEESLIEGLESKDDLTLWLHLRELARRGTMRAIPALRKVVDEERTLDFMIVLPRIKAPPKEWARRAIVVIEGRELGWN